MKRRKAISPVIAVVILVAISVTVAGLVSSWVNNLILRSTTASPCAGISTLYTLTGATHDTASGELKIKLKNIGKDSVYNFTFELDNGTISHIVASQPPPTESVGTGMSQYIIVNASNCTGLVKFTVLTEACPGYSPNAVTL